MLTANWGEGGQAFEELAFATLVQQAFEGLAFATDAHNV